MNDTLNQIGSTAHSFKPVAAHGFRPVLWNVAKIQAAACILVSACISAGLIAWGVYALW